MTALRVIPRSPTVKTGDQTVERGTRDDGLPILIVTPWPGPRARSATTRLRHAFAIRAELEAADAVVPVELRESEGSIALVCRDPGGAFMSEIMGTPLEPGSALRIAVAVAEALARFHESGLVHRDVKPCHILLSADQARAWLAGTGLALRSPRHYQPAEPPECLIGTLEYMAPEQTGRMNRCVDARSDLYALGVVLYELLTGQRPFVAPDATALLHCHLTQPALPPRSVERRVPEPLSRIVSKLLAKDAAERYQTARGLQADLRRCLEGWRNGGFVQDFELGTQDRPDRLAPPDKLIAREAETQALVAAFHRVRTTGRTEVVLVSGYSGVGKSSLIHELQHTLAAFGGLFASGRFDERRRDVPYAPVVAALTPLVRRILSFPQAALEAWRTRYDANLGPNGGVLCALIPELRAIVGDPPAPSELPPREAKARLHAAFAALIAVFARADQVLALFIDDLQWLDEATLELLEVILGRGETGHLLLLGAYRSNEVGAGHPLRLQLQRLKDAGVSLDEVRLEPLDGDAVDALVCTVLRHAPGALRPLSALVYEKTRGNPFFTIQFVLTLADEGLLSYAHDSGTWVWDAGHVRSRGPTDNVVDLLLGKIARQPAATKHLLETLACLGTQVDLAVLGQASGLPAADVEVAVEDAPASGLLIVTGDRCAFAHDRIGEAAYAVVCCGNREAAHLEIARRLSERPHLPADDEMVFTVASQFNRARSALRDHDERRRAAAANLDAARRARASAAYASALAYAVGGLQVLGTDDAAQEQPLAFALAMVRAECEVLTGQLAAAEATLDQCAARAQDPVERAAVTGLRIDLFTLADRSDRSVAVALDHLRTVGIDWPDHPGPRSRQAEYAQFSDAVAAVGLEALARLPTMEDPAAIATMDVLARLQVPAMFTDENLSVIVLARMGNLSLAFGNSPGSCFAYGWLAGYAISHLGDERTARSLARLSIDLVERAGLERLEARVYCLYGYLFTPWVDHLSAAREPLLKANAIARSEGDLTFVAYTSIHLTTLGLGSGQALPALEAEVEKGRAFAQQSRFGLVADFFTGQLACIRGLLDKAPAAAAGTESESEFEHRIGRDPRIAIAACWYRIRKLQKHYLLREYEQAEEAAEQAALLIWTSTAAYELAEFHFYASLARTAMAGQGPAESRPQRLAAARSHLDQIARWARHCAANFAHREALLGAEIARCEGRFDDAHRGYDLAIRLAHATGFVHDEALGYQLAAQFYAGTGASVVAEACRAKSRERYRRWGAEAVVALIDLDGQGPSSEERSETFEADPTLDQMDLGAVVTVAQALSAEILLEPLLRAVISASVQHSAAQRAAVVLWRRQQFEVAAEATMGQDAMEIMVPPPVAQPWLPESLMRYVVRSGEVVALADVARSELFAADPHLVRRRVRAVLCVPLKARGEPIGLIYLEHGALPNAFAPRQARLLQVLASQAAISLQNAFLFAELRDENAERRRTEELLAGEKKVLETIAEGRELAAIADELCLLARRCEPHWCCQFVFRDAASGERAIGAAAGLAESFTFDLQRLATEQGTPAVVAIATRQAVLVPDLDADDAGELADWRRCARAQGFRSCWSWPVVSASDEPLGALSVYHPQARGPLPSEVALVEQLTHLARVAAEHASKRGELQASEERFRNFANTLQDVIWITDLAPERVVYCSPSFERIWGFSVDDLYREPRLWFEAIHPDDIDRVREHFSRWVEGLDVGYHNVDFRIVRPSGDVRWIRESSVLYRNRDGVPYRVSGISADITDSKRAEHQLRQSEARLAEAQRIARMGNFSVGGEQDDFWSAEAYAILGHDRATPLNPHHLLARIHPEDQSVVVSLFDGSWPGGLAFEAECRLLMSDGSSRNVQLAGEVIVDERSGRREVRGTLRDITERKQADDAIQRAKAEIWHLNRVATLGELTASVAHEVNQPLTGIVTNAGVCLRSLGSDPMQIERAQNALNRIVRDGNRAAEVITRLRGLFRKAAVDKQALDVGEVVREVQTLVRNELRRKHVVLQVDIRDPLPRVHAARVQIQQVLLNLLLNAIESLASTADRERRVTIAATRHAPDAVAISVSDSGTGFAGEASQRMFEAFFTTKTNGMGIGLSISRSIVESHGGKLWAQANAGPGATFTFTLPTGTATIRAA